MYLYNISCKTIKIYIRLSIFELFKKKVKNVTNFPAFSFSEQHIFCCNNFFRRDMVTVILLKTAQTILLFYATNRIKIWCILLVLLALECTLPPKLEKSRDVINYWVGYWENTSKADTSIKLGTTIRYKLLNKITFLTKKKIQNGGQNPIWPPWIFTI